MNAKSKLIFYKVTVDLIGKCYFIFILETLISFKDFEIEIILLNLNVTCIVSKQKEVFKTCKNKLHSSGYCTLLITTYRPTTNKFRIRCLCT